MIRKFLCSSNNTTFSAFPSNSKAFLNTTIFFSASITILDLRGNQLTVLPPEIGQLIRLTHLDLCDNQLVQLPIELTQIQGFEVLLLLNNALEAIPTALHFWQCEQDPQKIARALKQQRQKLLHLYVRRIQRLQQSQTQACQLETVLF